MIEQNNQTNSILNLESAKILDELNQKERNLKAKPGYLHAYVLSVILPPIGIYYFIKYVFLKNETEEDTVAGIISLALTISSILLNIWLFGVMFKQSASLIPSQNLDILKELITPANQNKYIDFFK